MVQGQQLSRRKFLWVTAGAAGGVVVGACSTDESGGEAQEPGAGDTPDGPLVLRFHDRTSAPDTLDPARAFSPVLGYDALIGKAPDGSYQPELATSWGYVGEGNTTFEIVLRPDVTFTDGTPLTADAVKANIDYRLDPSVGSQAAAQLSTVTEVEIVDDLTARVHLSEPNPVLVELFSGNAGTLISPEALKDPSVLSTETYGVGRYMLDPDETVHGDHYTWVPDPNYWNPDVVYWDQVVVRIIPELSSALAALQTGEIDASRADSTIYQAGLDAGLSGVGPGFPIVLGLSLFDREGQTSPALGDVRVRQALNHAIDREKIASALIGELGRPTDQMSAPEQPGWHDEPFYPYDQDRARELLAEAGYADGFSFRVRIPQSDQLVRLSEAVADELSQVGVEMDIHAVAGAQFDQADDATNQDYGAVFLGWGIETPFRMARSFWLPDASNNAFDTVDETLVDLHEQIAVAPEENQEELNRQVVARVAELGWFLPVVIHGEAVLFNSEVVDVPWTAFASIPDVSEMRPAGS